MTSTDPTTDNALRLDQRRVIVTGGASGIGRATATLFRKMGAQVAIFDRDAAAAEHVSSEIGAVAMPVDIMRPEQITDAVERAAAKMGGIDGIVNAAGITTAASIADTSLAMWQHTININLTGPFLVVQAALVHLRAADHATIVNISSGAGLLPRPDRTAYSASKGGLLALTRAMAVELAPAIRVNAICPGSVETPMLSTSNDNDAGSKNDSGKAGRLDRYALKRLGTPDELANAILFLTSRQSSYVTGVTLSVDGGRTFH